MVFLLVRYCGVKGDYMLEEQEIEDLDAEASFDGQLWMLLGLVLLVVVLLFMLNTPWGLPVFALGVIIGIIGLTKVIGRDNLR